MFSGFQSNAYQSNAYQIGSAVNDNNVGGWSYTHPYIEAQNERIRKEKSELQKLESVIAENQRKADLAAKSRAEAKQAAALRLARLENEYLEEISRLMQVKSLLLQRIRRNEEELLMLLMLKRRRA